MGENQVEKTISTKELYAQYDWFANTFPVLIQDACDDFFDNKFQIKFIGLSKNINCLLGNESCFVTKIAITSDYDMFFRLTEKSISIILDKILGKSKTRFNINKVSEIESKIITSFNGFMYNALKNKLNSPDPKELKRSNFDSVNLTFIIKDEEDEEKRAGKIIITLPQELLSPDTITSSEPKFNETNFPKSITFAKVIIGKTMFSLYDLKHLEEEDVVVFENSNIENVTLEIQGTTIPVNINPNMELIIPQENDGGENMPDELNIWDSIEVEMNAEFDAVKITLGELKDIEDGLVVDLTSLYDNNVTLKVEGKPIASGSLVIVNDRYGVKINKVIADSPEEEPSKQAKEDNSYPEEAGQNYAPETPENNLSGGNTPNEQGGEEDFDYSDFDLEDENL